MHKQWNRLSPIISLLVSPFVQLDAVVLCLRRSVKIRKFYSVIQARDKESSFRHVFQKPWPYSIWNTWQGFYFIYEMEKILLLKYDSVKLWLDVASSQKGQITHIPVPILLSNHLLRVVICSVPASALCQKVGVHQKWTHPVQGRWDLCETWPLKTLWSHPPAQSWVSYHKSPKAMSC